jgi:hypothetical protein
MIKKSLPNVTKTCGAPVGWLSFGFLPASRGAAIGAKIKNPRYKNAGSGWCKAQIL